MFKIKATDAQTFISRKSERHIYAECQIKNDRDGGADHSAVNKTKTKREIYQTVCPLRIILDFFFLFSLKVQNPQRKVRKLNWVEAAREANRWKGELYLNFVCTKVCNCDDTALLKNVFSSVFWYFYILLAYLCLYKIIKTGVTKLLFTWTKQNPAEPMLESFF